MKAHTNSNESASPKPPLTRRDLTSKDTTLDLSPVIEREFEQYRLEAE